mmetsp:Transcript_21351/g.87203  ORF Transcript_21351/g.87203 Transcript_21351/m.87203 type:complete len:99 (+) Transcript_21351:178-474(+)
MDWLARAGWVLLLAGVVSAAIDCTVAFEGGEAEFDTCQSIMGGAKLFYSFVGDEVDMAFQVNLDVRWSADGRGKRKTSLQDFHPFAGLYESGSVASVL